MYNHLHTSHPPSHSHPSQLTCHLVKMPCTETLSHHHVLKGGGCRSHGVMWGSCGDHVGLCGVTASSVLTDIQCPEMPPCGVVPEVDLLVACCLEQSAGLDTDSQQRGCGHRGHCQTVDAARSTLRGGAVAVTNKPTDQGSEHGCRWGQRGTCLSSVKP